MPRCARMTAFASFTIGMWPPPACAPGMRVSSPAGTYPLRSGPAFRRSADRQTQRKASTHARRAVNADAAGMLVDDDGARDRESLPAAAPHFLGGEERIVNFIDDCLRDTAAVVLELQ